MKSRIDGYDKEVEETFDAFFAMMAMAVKTTSNARGLTCLANLERINCIPSAELKSEEIDRICKRVKPKCGMCFFNAGRIATDTDAEYVEGFMIPVMDGQVWPPIPHAWNMLDGKYFDVTGEACCRKFQKIYPDVLFEESVFYRGIVIDKEFLLKRFCTTTVYRSYLCEWLEESFLEKSEKGIYTFHTSG